eukprot:2240247-Pyramimonas_sp.AAC.1
MCRWAVGSRLQKAPLSARAGMPRATDMAEKHPPDSLCEPPGRDTGRKPPNACRAVYGNL